MACDFVQRKGSDMTNKITQEDKNDSEKPGLRDSLAQNLRLDPATGSAQERAPTSIKLRDVRWLVGNIGAGE